MNRCNWCIDHPLYMEYHDKEWGVAVREDQKLFEFIILEGAQAGLNWFTILKRREGYRKAFADFNPEKVARFNSKKMQRLLTDEGIIRHQKKIESAVQNAKAFLKIQKEFGSFADYLWGFVDGKPIKNRWHNLSEIPTKTELSNKVSKDLKKRGFSFVGSTIIYAYLQAIGVVNDHVLTCFKCKMSSRA